MLGYTPQKYGSIFSRPAKELCNSNSGYVNHGKKNTTNGAAQCEVTGLFCRPSRCATMTDSNKSARIADTRVATADYFPPPYRAPVFGQMQIRKLTLTNRSFDSTYVTTPFNLDHGAFIATAVLWLCAQRGGYAFQLFRVGCTSRKDAPIELIPGS